MDVRYCDPEAVVQAGLAEIKGRVTADNRDERRVLVSGDDEIEPRPEPAVSDIVSCERGCLHGLRIWSKVGEAGAELAADLCACTEELSGNLRDQLGARANSLRMSELPPLFANRSYMGRTFAEAAPPILQSWLKEACGRDKLAPQHSCIFLCGKLGTGKTHMASDCIKHFIMATGLSSRYFTASALVEIKKDSVIYGSRHAREDKDRVDYFKRAMHSAGLMVVDEIRESLSRTEAGYLEEFIDMRYNTGLPTIYISNHTFQARTSYKRITLQRVLGERIADRMRASLCHEFTAPSKRGVRMPDSYTAEEMNSFCLPKSVLVQKDGKMQILNWMTRNPVFEAIRDDRREIATNQDGSPVLLHGIPKDAPREKIKVCHDVWQKGDVMTVEGPVLGIDDAKTYLVCLSLLAEQHSRGGFGLNITLTPAVIMRALGKRSRNSDNRKATHRSLRRISAANINYVDNLGREWSGPLFDFSYRPDENEGNYSINFNKSMISFYKNCEYTNLHGKLFEAKIGADGLRMQMFLRSHSESRFDRMSVDEWLRFLEKPVGKMDKSEEGKRIRRYHRGKFARLVKMQAAEGLLAADSTLKKGGNVCLTVTPL